MSRYKVALTVQDNAPSFYGVFDTFNKSAGFNGTLISRHSTEADARLIAAAPELLAALQLVCDSGVNLAEPIERAMLDAIAKATQE